MDGRKSLRTEAVTRRGVTIGSYAYGVGNPNLPQQQITLRGFAAQTFFRNGFRLQQGSASRDMSNVEAIEVLKGPAAILYGLVEPGGMVNVITKQPQATPYYAVNQQFGSYDLFRTTLDATGPLTENKDLLYRVNMSYQNNKSFRDLVFDDNVFINPVLKWIVSPKTQVTAEMEYQHKNFTTDLGFIPILNGQLMNIPRSYNYGEYSPGIQDTVFAGLNLSHQFNDDWSIKQRLSANLVNGFIPISTYPSYQAADPSTFALFKSYFPNMKLDPTAVYGLDYYSQKTNQDTYSGNIDLTGHFDTLGLNHTLLLGGDYYRLNTIGRSSGNLNNFFAWYGGGNPPSSTNIYNPVHPGNNYPQAYDPTVWSGGITNTDQYGVYIQDQIKLPYDVHVMGGIRYQNIHQGSVNQDSTGLTTKNMSQSQDAVTPRVGILWQAQNWLSMYANYAESFGANSGYTWPNSQIVPPTSAAQYEGGLKAELFGGRLRGTLAYYDLTKTNIASGDPDPTHICFGARCSVVVGAVHSQGPELDIQGEILPGWNAIATYANTSINITKTDTQNSAYLGLYSVGNRYWGVPRNTASLFTTYEISQDELFKGLKFGGGVNIQDGQTSCCVSPMFNIPGFATVDLLAAYSLNVGKTKVTAQLNVKNLLDKYYLLGGGIDSPTGMFATFGLPRYFMGSIGVQF
jgi:iron complex outermembrane receptor protein